MKHSALLDQIGGFGVALDGFSEVRNRPVSIATQTSDLGSQVPRTDFVGLLLEQGAECGDRVGGIALTHPS